MPASDARPILRIRSPIIGRGEQVFELDGRAVTIGRADECDVVLLEQSASRVHARLVPEDGGWTLVDEGSNAGVFMGTQRVRRQKLEDGARFRIGETDFQLVMRPGSQPTLVGGTRPPSNEPRDPIPSIGIAPTLASDQYFREASEGPMPSEISTAPIERAPLPLEPPPRPAPPPPPIAVAPAPMPTPVQVVPPRRGPPPSAPSFVDFGPVGRPEQDRQGESFTGQLVDDPSRMGQIDQIEGRVTSRFGTWILVVFLFLGLSAIVIGLAYDITLSDVMAVFE